MCCCRCLLILLLLLSNWSLLLLLLLLLLGYNVFFDSCNCAAPCKCLFFIIKASVQTFFPLFLLPSCNIHVQRISILLYWELLVIVHVNVYDPATHCLLLRAVKLADIRVLQSLLNSVSVFGVENEQLFNKIEALFPRSSKQLVEAFPPGDIYAGEDIPTKLRIKSVDVFCLWLSCKF